MNTCEKGKLGELYTVDYLKKNGINIITTNYHSRYGEIDIIASDSKYIMFIEVKLRGRKFWVSPSEAVTKQKQKKIIKTASKYLLNNKSELQPRFDVSEVKITYGNIVKLEYIKNAFWQDDEYSAF